MVPILFLSLKNFRSKEIYNISDDKPASSEEITMYAAKLLGLKISDRVDFNLIESEMLRDFYKDSKKVSNKKMKLFFNYELVHPTYIEGLNHIRDNSI